MVTELKAIKIYEIAESGNTVPFEIESLQQSQMAFNFP